MGQMTHSIQWLPLGITFLMLAIPLVIQFSVKRSIPWVYWLTVSMVAIFGTVLADQLLMGVGLSTAQSTMIFSAALALIFVAWYLTERTVSIHSITTRRREAFYWLTVMATFGLGTAAGDWTADALGLGYLDSGLMFGAAILLAGLAFWKLRSYAIFIFWFAYVLTRPAGASFADYLQSGSFRGGLGLGSGTVAVAATVVILGLVGYLSLADIRSRKIAKPVR
jgi:uncharacterized membrane-anchored protein